jgi:heme/copper-type cytochrome/quinol oxidase subunit 3
MTDSLSFYYIIFAIVLLHVLLGFAWVIYKMMKPGKNSTAQSEKEDKK